MWQYTIKVDGMMCSMCEAHVNEAVRKALPEVKKVKSSHTKGETVVVAENELDENALRESISKTGYEVQGITKAPKKKGLFGF